MSLLHRNQIRDGKLYHRIAPSSADFLPVSLLTEHDHLQAYIAYLQITGIK
jgi:hypothetical protein